MLGWCGHVVKNDEGMIVKELWQSELPVNMHG